MDTVDWPLDVDTTGCVDPSALVALGQVVLVLIGRHTAKMGGACSIAKVATELKPSCIGWVYQSESPPWDRIIVSIGLSIDL